MNTLTALNDGCGVASAFSIVPSICSGGPTLTVRISCKWRAGPEPAATNGTSRCIGNDGTMISVGRSRSSSAAVRLRDTMLLVRVRCGVSCDTVAAYQACQLKEMNLVGGVASIGTALIAWSQRKHSSDLDTSYPIAAGDLRRIGEVRLKVETQEQLDLLVQEVETAVSREHSMWLARRVASG
jgi:hypothetical protein